MVLDTLLNALQALLDQEVLLHEALLERLQEEAEGYGKAPGTELLNIQAKRDQLVKRIQQLEKERVNLVEQIADQWGIPFERLRLRQIAERVPD